MVRACIDCRVRMDYRLFIWSLGALALGVGTTIVWVRRVRSTLQQLFLLPFMGVRVVGVIRTLFFWEWMI